MHHYLMLQPKNTYNIKYQKQVRNTQLSRAFASKLYKLVFSPYRLGGKKDENGTTLIENINYQDVNLHDRKRVT